MIMEYGDFDLISSALEKELYDALLFQILGSQENRMIGIGSFKVSYSSATQVSVAAGIGFQTGSSDDSAPQKQLLYRATSSNHAVAAAHASLGRIDIVSIKAARATALTEMRDFKDAEDDSVASQSMVVQTDWYADIVVTTGTPNASPVAPSTPAGYIKIATISVPAATGPSSQSDITDNRTIMSLPPVQKTFDLANNQASAANITGLTFDPNIIRGVVLHYDIYRQTVTAFSECREMGTLYLVYSFSEAVWRIERVAHNVQNNDTGIEFSMSGNQLQYTSTNISGSSYTGLFSYKAEYYFNGSYS